MISTPSRCFVDSFDDLMGKRFDLRTYNCWDLTREVWLRLTGQVLNMLFVTARTAGEVAEAEKAQYREIPEAVSPCIALFQRDRFIPHVGVYLNGRVLHIRRAGVQYSTIEVASFGFTSTRFYLPCQS